MNRNITEFLKIPESIRIPIVGGCIYRMLNYLDNNSILEETIPLNPLNIEKRDKKIILSLTSYPDRIGYVYLAIKSLMLQTVKPDRIILWLAEEQFPDKKLPEELTNLINYGLEICWVKDNLYGHKKYFYCLQEQLPDELVITYDDDIIYPKCSIERLIKTHRKFPEAIVCNRAQALLDKKRLSRSENPGRWNTISNVGVKLPSYRLAPSTGGGCLYPYGAIKLNLLKPDDICEIALRGDDLWIMFVAAESSTKFIKTHKYHKIFSIIRYTQISQLAIDNILNNQYTNILEKLKAKFPKAWEKIINDN